MDINWPMVLVAAVLGLIVAVAAAVFLLIANREDDEQGPEE